MRRYWRMAPWFLAGTLLVTIVAWALGILPSHALYCYADEGGHKECGTYNIVLVAFWEIGKGLNWVSPAITALATAAVAYFTGTIWSINRSQLAHTRQVERAYVSGGATIRWEPGDSAWQKGPGGTYHEVQTPRPRWLVVTVDNHGKTPAKVSEIAVSVCTEAGLPKPADLQADYERSKRLVDLNLAPATTGLQTRLLFDFTEAAGKIVYGRIYYTDIFRESHSSGFILKVMPQGDTVAFEASPEYTAWD